MALGHKTGGRKAGSKNKLKVEVESIKDELETRMGCDPIAGMARIAKHPKASLDLQGRMYAELASYVYAKRKAVEHTGAAASGGITVVVRSVLQPTEET